MNIRHTKTGHISIAHSKEYNQQAFVLSAFEQSYVAMVNTCFITHAPGTTNLLLNWVNLEFVKDKMITHIYQNNTYETLQHSACILK